jgi:RimJ/RimL family protein N-acetyltransferase
MPPLSGSLVRLEPLAIEHCAPLVAAASEQPDLYMWSGVPRSVPEMQAYIEAALASQEQGHMRPFAIVLQGDDRVVGTTRYYGIERWAWPLGHREHGRATPDVCDIGYTWLARSSMRTGVNTQAKRLLLQYAFETWRVHRVGLRTDVRNVRSRSAIERIGAKLDGCLRSERPATDGAVRDSAVYSIVASEWPAVSELLARLEERP